MDLKVQRLTQDEFDAIRTEWNDLLDRSASDTVFLRWEWIHSWWSIFRKKRKLLVLTLREAGRLVGVAPFFIEPALFPIPRQLRFCSDELSPDYMDVILEKGMEEPATQALVRYLLEYSHEWDMISLNSMRAESTLLPQGLFGSLAWSIRTAFKAPYISIQGHFDDYFKSRKRLVSFNLPKNQQKFFQQPGTRHVKVLDLLTLPQCMDDMFNIRTKRSASLGLYTSFVDKEAKQFHKKVSALFLNEGILNLQLMYDQDTAVSMGYAFNYKKKTYLFQTAFDPAYKKWSPGGLILREMVREAFENGFSEFDTLKGDYAYKDIWCNNARREMELTIYNSSLRGRIALGGRRLKGIFRKIKWAVWKKPQGVPAWPGIAAMPEPKYDALVLNASLRQSLATVRSLGRRGLKIAVSGTKYLAPAFASRWCREPFAFPLEEESTGYLAKLEKWLDHVGARVLIPSHDGTIALIRQNRERIERRVRVALASEEALMIAVNKERTFEVAGRLGIRLPRQVVLQHVKDLPRAISRIEFPAVVKPCESWLRHDRKAVRMASRLVTNEQEARAAIEDVTQFGESVQYQQFLTGRREAVSFMYANGKVHARFAQWATRTHPPLGGESTVRHSIEVPEDIGAQAEALIRAIHLEGYSEVEFRRDAAGIPYLMEVNPRLSASVEVAVRSGVDFPFMLYQWALGVPIDTVEKYKTDVWMRYLGGDIESTLAALHERGRPGIPSPAQTLARFALSFCKPMGYDYFHWSDPLPAVRATAQFGLAALKRLRKKRILT